MTTTLNTAELNTLETMRTNARGDSIKYWEIYKWLADTLDNKGDSSLNQTILWLRGATEANAGRGAFSALIRSYTETQCQLRYGSKPDEPTMQRASNEVAENLIK